MNCTGKSTKSKMGKERNTTIMLATKAPMRRKLSAKEDPILMRRRGTRKGTRAEGSTTSTTKTNSKRSTSSTMTSTKVVITIDTASSMHATSPTRVERRRRIMSTQDTTTSKVGRRDTATRATWMPTTKAITASTVTTITTNTTSPTARKEAGKEAPIGVITRNISSYHIRFKEDFSSLGIVVLIMPLIAVIQSSFKERVIIPYSYINLSLYTLLDISLLEIIW